MKNKVSFFVDFSLTVMLVLGVLWCNITAFEVNVNPIVIIVSTLIFTSIFSLISALIKSRTKFLLSIAVIAIIFTFTVLFSLESILSQTGYFINQILSYYSKYLAVPDYIILGTENSNDATLFLVFIAFILCSVISVSLIRARRLLPVSIISISPIIPCFILVNTLPSLIPLILVVSILFSLYITSFFRRKNPTQNGIVTIIITAFTILTAVVICLINPVEGYERYEWQDNLLSYMHELTGFKSNDSLNNNISKSLNEIGNSLSEKENLAEIGPIEQKSDKAMRIFTETNGPIYLKGLAYADFNNNEWSILSNEQSNIFPKDFNSFTMTKSHITNNKEISIITESSQDIMYSPYFSLEIPENFSALGDVCIRNNNKLLSYDINYSPYSESLVYFTDETSKEYNRFVEATYLGLPDDTKQKMREIADRNGLTALKKSEIPNAVKEFVSKKGYYSLDTPKMPDGKDFPVWFLEEAESGYCVHYATAAAVMLRALGVPARYVTGYYANAESGRWTTVTSDNAHAWVEYYDSTAGWIPLEATPSSFRPWQYNNTLTDTEAEQTTQQQDVTQSATEQATNAPDTLQESTAAVQIDKNENNNKNTSDYGILNSVLISVGIVLAIILTIIIRRIIILRTRASQFEKGRNNRRAKYIYRYILKIMRFSNNPIPNEVEESALKAKFSNHTIDKKELDVLLYYADNAKNELYNNSSLIKRVYFKFIVVI